MTISALDATILDYAGYTPGEIEILAKATMPDGSDQPPIDLTNPFWREALDDRLETMETFNRVSAREDIEVTREDWNNFITRWYIDTVKEADPWIFIDAVYGRVQVGKITKPRWQDALNKVKILKERIR